MAENRAQIVIGAENKAEGVINKVRSQLGGLRSDAEPLVSTFSKLGVVFTAAFAGGSFLTYIKGAVDGLDKLNDVADVTGSSIEKISALEDIGARTGAGIDVIEGALVKLNAQLKEADGKNGVSLALKQIGLDAQQLKQLDPADALLQTSQALAAFADDGNKARLVQELFGKSVKEVGPFLKDLAEKGQLNATVTTEQAKQAEAFNKQLFALQKNSVDTARNISGPLIEALNGLFDKFKQFDGITGFIKADLGIDKLGLLKTESAQLSEEVTRSTDTVLRLNEALSRDPDNKILAGRLDKARERLDKLRQQAAVTAQALKNVADEMAPPDTSDAFSRRVARGEGARSVGDLAVASSSKATKALTNDAELYLQRLQEQYITTLDLTTAEKALIDIRATGFKGLTPELEELIVQQARIIDQDKEQARQRKLLNDVLDENVETQRTFFEEANNLFLSTRTPLEKFVMELGRLNILLGKGLDPQTYARAVEQARDAYKSATEGIKTDYDEFTKNLISGTQDVLASTFEQLGSRGFKDLDQQFGDLLQRLAAQAVAADLTRRLFGEDGKGLNDLGSKITEQINSIDFSKLTEQLSSLVQGFGSSVAGLFSGSGSGGSGGTDYGQLLSSVFAGAFADGGYAAANKVALVGERGPELIFTGNRGTTVQPMVMGGGGNTYAPQITINVPQGTGRATADQIAARAADAVARASARKR